MGISNPVSSSINYASILHEWNAATVHAHCPFEDVE
jgi:hypothetical protein